MVRGSINTLKTKTLNQSFQKLKPNQLCKAWHVFAKHQQKTSCTIRGLTWYKDAQHDSAVSTQRAKLISTDTLPRQKKKSYFLEFAQWSNVKVWTPRQAVLDDRPRAVFKLSTCVSPPPPPPPPLFVCLWNECGPVAYHSNICVKGKPFFSWQPLSKWLN